MSNTIYAYIVFYSLAFSCLVWLLINILKVRSVSLASEPLVENDQSMLMISLPWYKKLNLGAFMLSFLWLWINGFWISAIVYGLMAFLAWPFAIIISVVLLFKGTELSWSDGARWGYDIEKFKDEQYFTYLISVFWLVLIFLAIIMSFVNSYF